MKINYQIPNTYENHLNTELLLNEICDEFKHLIPTGPFLGDKEIIIIKSVEAPIAFPDLLPNKYLIGLTCNELFYCQIAYQFAHELCHVYIDPRVTNWLIESFCESLSMIILERLSVKWQTNRSIPASEPYAINYTNYLADVINTYLGSLKISVNEV